MSFGAIAMGMMGTGALTGAIGSYYGAKTQQSNLATQAKLNDINAKISESAAQSALLAGQREEQGSRLRTAQLKSAQRTSMAANGIDLASDTALNILTTTDVMGESDANTIAANAVRAAWGYRTQATNQSNQAMMDRSSAAGINPGMSAASSLLGSATSMATSWYGLKKSGAFN